MNQTIYAFILTLIAGLSTLIGSFLIFIKRNNNIIIFSLAFASGVMIFVSLFDLIPESFILLSNKYNLFLSILLIAIFFCIGVIISMTINKYIPTNNNKLYRVGVISMLAIILHNIPEGIVTFIAINTNIKLGITLFVAIALHNIPEGISISIPIYYGTNNKKKALFYTFISGISEFIGAIITYLFLQKYINDNTTLSLLFSVIGGLMIHISLYELIPTSLKYKNNKLTALAFIMGFIIMYITKILI